MKWDRDAKRREVVQSGMKYLVACPNDTVPAAFLNYKLTSEEDLRGQKFAVAYCYELQVDALHQGQRLGSLLLAELERRVKKQMKRPLVMLTCFKANQRALAFYQRHGYAPDPISPSRCNPKGRCDYEILSKYLT